MDISSASTTTKSDSILIFNTGASSTSFTRNNNNFRMLEDMFEKVLVPSDFVKRLVIPRRADMDFPLDSSKKILTFQERNGKLWTFRTSFWNSTKSYVMTTGWTEFAQEKMLQAGDTISFHREITDKYERLYIDWRHRDAGESGLGSTNSTAEGTSNPDHECSAFNSFLNTRGLTLSGCKATDVIDFLCMQKNMDDPNALVCRLSAASERCGIKPKDNPFRSLTVIRYLQLLRRVSGKTECIVFSFEDYDNKKILGDISHQEEIFFTKQIVGVLHEKNIISLTCNLSLENLDVEMFYRCKVGVMVISKSFARNSHSLDHLVTIMERWKAKDLVLIPVYYEVTLSDILEGRYQPVQQQYLNYFQADKVPKWKVAIAELASIDGHQFYKHWSLYRHMEVVSLACSRIYLKNTDNLVKILALLDQPQLSDAAEFEGIWGVPGIDFHLLCQRKGLRQIRDGFFSKIFGEEKPCIGSCGTKPSFLRDWFHNKSILIILDDVSNARDAEYVVGGFDWFSRGHKIILTSRKKQVLVQCKVKNPYKMQKLIELETSRLFNAYYTKGNEVDFPLVSVINLSSGIPLAIKVMGETTWNYLNYHELRKHPPDEIEKAFRRSYDGLDENEKNIFLDLACFFQGENKDHVVQLLDACGFLTDLESVI